MDAEDQHWMEYIDGEVKAACEGRGWGHQIRRKWSVREKPVPESTLDDYEWKLIPDAKGKLPDAPPGDFDGVYYVLGFDKPNGRFVLQHDTSHCGIMGPHWEVATYTEIRPNLLRTRVTSEWHTVSCSHPPEGWLREHLEGLIARFGPNNFSVT